ncbi:universal stress protein [Geminocystis sp.]|uniref:universal stress protein n=1 Tax=Geminocystis sp. TaxID=2664100 RepID=UPI003593162E
MKNILLCTDGSSYAENIYKYGAWIAQKLDAEINVLSVTDIRTQQAISTGNLSGSIGLGASDELLQKLVELEHEKAKLNHQRAKLILKTAEEILKNEGITNIKLTHKTGFLVDSLQEFEQNADLIILGKRGENADFASTHLGANLDRIIRSSHKPCFVIPREFNPIDKVLIAYDGSVTGDKILKFLRENPLVNNLELHILTIAKAGVENTYQDKLNQAVSQLKEAGFNTQSSLLQDDAEKVISNYITQNNINFLIMGAYGHSRIRHLIIGSTTVQLLRSTTIPVLLFR